MKGFAGFDIGGTNARAWLFDADWAVLGQARRSARGASPEAMAQLVREMLLALCEGAALPPAQLYSVGVGIAAQLDAPGEVVLNAPNLAWRDVAFAEMISRAIHQEIGQHRVRLVNDLNAILWGEHAAGAVQDAADVLAVYVGTGVGGAILSRGRIYTGGGKAGEIGHAKVVPGGRLCGCGENGCVEAYAGGLNLEQMAAEIARQEGSDLGVEDAPDILADLQLVDQLAARGHPAYERLWRRATDYLALTLANACTLLNPAVLLLGGGVLENLADFRQRLLNKVPGLVLAVARADLEIRFPTLGDKAGVLGAARLAAGGAD